MGKLLFSFLIFVVFYGSVAIASISVVRLGSLPNLVRCPNARSCFIHKYGPINEKVLNNMELGDLGDLGDLNNSDLLSNVAMESANGCFGTENTNINSGVKPFKLCTKGVSVIQGKPKKVVAENVKIMGNDLDNIFESGIVQNMMMELLKESMKNQAFGSPDNINLVNQAEKPLITSISSISGGSSFGKMPFTETKSDEHDSDTEHVIFKLLASADLKVKHQKDKRPVTTGIVEASVKLDMNPEIRNADNAKQNFINEYKPLMSHVGLPNKLNGLKIFGGGQRIPSIVKIFPIRQFGGKTFLSAQNDHELTNTTTASPVRYYDSAYTNQALYDSTYTNEAMHGSFSNTTTAKPCNTSEYEKLDEEIPVGRFTTTIMNISDGINKFEDALRGYESSTTTVKTNTETSTKKVTNTTTKTTISTTVQDESSQTYRVNELTSSKKDKMDEDGNKSEQLDDDETEFTQGMDEDESTDEFVNKMDSNYSSIFGDE